MGARPRRCAAGRGKKGADKGIDRRIYYHEELSGKPKQIVLSVKAGHVTASQVRDLRRVIEREKAEIGVRVSLEEPTAPMRREAADAGVYEPVDQKDENRLRYPRRFFEREQFAAARAHLPRTCNPSSRSRTSPAGAPPPEVFSLEWRHVDFATGELRLDPHTTKNDDGRVFLFDLMAELKTLLENQRAEYKRLAARKRTPSPYVFTRNGACIKWITNAWGGRRARMPRARVASLTTCGARPSGVSCGPG